jgi:hypothetical protein
MLESDKRGFANDMAAYRKTIEGKAKKIEGEPENDRLDSYTKLLEEIDKSQKTYEDIKLLQIAVDATTPEMSTIVCTSRDTISEDYKGLLRLREDIENRIKYLRQRAEPVERTQLLR